MFYHSFITNKGNLPTHVIHGNPRQHINNGANNAYPTAHYSRPVLSQGIQSSAPTMVPRASLLQANANATYQRPALVCINFFLVRINSCR